MTAIWRYMDLWKFESIMEKQKLFFSTAASQVDGLEGMYPLLARINRAQRVEDLPLEQQSYALHNQEVDERVSTHEIILSCWHINDNENPRMWRDYLTTPEGVAIQTTKEALQDSFSAFSHPDRIISDTVQYVKRSMFRGLMNRRLEVFFHKDESYSWENEWRCAIDVMTGPLPHDPDGTWNAECLHPNGKLYSVGYFIPVEVNVLVKRIVVSPEVSDKFFHKVKNICNQHGLTKPVVRSLREGRS